MSYKSKNLIGSLILFTFFFAIPAIPAKQYDSITLVTLLFLSGLGILFSKLMILSSNKKENFGIESVIIVILGSWNCSSLLYPVVLISLFLGSLLNSLRTDKRVNVLILQNTFQSFLFITLIKLATFVHWNLPINSSEGAVQAYTVLFLSLIVVVSVRFLSIIYINSNYSYTYSKSLIRNNLLLYSFLLLVAIPSSYTISIGDDTLKVIFNSAFSIISIIFLTGLNLKMNRASFEQSSEIETELALKKLSKALFTSNSEINVIKILCLSISEAWKCNSAVKWKTLIYFNGKKWDTSSAVLMEHPSGLCVWIDSFSSTIPVYINSFINRAVPVLINLETEKKLSQASWDSMETLVSFVEEDASDFAGFSRKVAATAYNLTAALNMSDWYKDCMRLAGLLHMVEKQKITQSNSDQQLQHFALPEITSSAIDNFTEQWLGSGPTGKSKEDIPLPARILAVSIAWEKIIPSGKVLAKRDLTMKSGKIYDPEIVNLVIQINS